MSTEGKFFHRSCFRCDYCNILLRLGSYVYHREGPFEGEQSHEKKLPCTHTKEDVIAENLICNLMTDGQKLLFSALHVKSKCTIFFVEAYDPPLFSGPRPIYVKRREN